MKFLLATAAVLLTTTAFAGERSEGHYKPKPTSHVSQKQGQAQGQAQGQMQGQAAIASNSGSVSVAGDNTKASAYAPSLGGFASGPCVGTGVQGTVGVVGFGAGLGVSSLDESCTRRETARVLHMMGQQDLALKVMLQDPVVQKVLAPQPAVLPAPQAAVSSGYCARNPSDYYCKSN